MTFLLATTCIGLFLAIQSGALRTRDIGAGANCMSKAGATIVGHQLEIGNNPRFLNSVGECCTLCSATTGCKAAVFGNFLCDMKNTSKTSASTGHQTVVIPASGPPPTPTSTPSPNHHGGPTTSAPTASPHSSGPTSAPSNHHYSPADKVCMKAASSCGSCTEQGNHCGWCNDTQTCMSGNANFGPTTCTQWVPYEGSCHDPCGTSSITSCGECMTAPWGCGWCQTTQTCMRGGLTGPQFSSCPGGWEFGESAETCSHCQTQYADCQTCATDANCVWCESQTTCFSGNSSGAYFANGNSCNSFVHNNISQCTPFTPAPPSSQCQQYGDCGSCLAHRESDGCGWCASKAKCFNGDSEGANFPHNCDNRWHWHHCEINCSHHQKCGDCVSDESSECGWCMLSQTCLKGTSSGPHHGSCSPGPYWQFGPYACPGCSGVTGGCDSCMFQVQGTGGCGYCGATKQCVEGAPSGPLNGTCSGNWTYSDYFCPSGSKSKKLP